MKRLYSNLALHNCVLPNTLFNTLQIKFKLPYKLTHFLWLCFINSLSTPHTLFSKHIGPSPFCPHYHQDESLIHLFWEFPRTLSIWHNAPHPPSHPHRHLLTLVASMVILCTSQALPPLDFCFCKIWKNRNAHMFNNTQKSPHILNSHDVNHYHIFSERFP